MEYFQKQLYDMRHNYACKDTNNTVIVIGDLREFHPETTKKE
jgi:gamma-glutamylcyclotransferase (GGCT)/AIG2-like uncharacterized protein YtfP